MRLKASFTVESSVIIPLFTMIIVVLVILSLDLHDDLIKKSVCFQAAMKTEQENNKNDNEYVAKVVTYANMKTMRHTYLNDSINKGIEEINVLENNPKNFIRKTKAALNLAGKGSD